MRLVFGPLALEKPDLSGRLEVLVGVIADFRIEIGGRPFFHEPEFPVVELAACLQQWLADLDQGTIADFVYDSMEADEPLLLFRQRDDGWNVSSPWQQYEDTSILATDEVRDAARRFVQEVQTAAATELKLDVGPWIDADPARA